MIIRLPEPAILMDMKNKNEVNDTKGKIYVKLPSRIKKHAGSGVMSGFFHTFVQSVLNCKIPMILRCSLLSVPMATVTRYGKTSSNGYGVMDNLTLTYDGNRLAGVSETASDYDAYGSFEYKRKNGSEYIYNANGSLVADRSRGIAYITYDLNGNPVRIQFTDGSVTRYINLINGGTLIIIRENETYIYNLCLYDAFSSHGMHRRPFVHT